MNSTTDADHGALTRVVSGVIAVHWCGFVDNPGGSIVCTLDGEVGFNMDLLSIYFG
jgi:hypothetical protein